MPDFVAKEALELAAETQVGRVALSAAERTLAEVMDLAGMKRWGDYLRSGKVTPQNMQVFQKVAEDIASGAKISVGFNAVKNPLQIPENFFAGGRYSTEIFGPIENPLYRVVPLVPEPGPRIAVGDIVAIDGRRKRVTGDLLSLHLEAEAGPTAIVKLHAEQAALLDVNKSGVNQVNTRLWRNEAGAVFSTQPGHVSDFLSDPSSLKFLPNIRALDPDKVSFVSGVRTLPKSAESYIANNNALIQRNVSNPESFLCSLASAPKLQFADSPLIDWRSSSIFNPRGLSTNCMGCTAGIVRTLRTGSITTADDVAKMVAKDGVRIGAPYSGRFENEHQAFQWFSDAANVRIADTVHDPNRLKVGRNYALTVNLNPRSGGDSLHMAFAHRFDDGAAVFYDGQSGIQWHEQSFVRGKLPVNFHELKFLD